MFVLELSKPSGICLAAVRRRRAGRLPDLLALRHGLARDERRRRPDPAPPRHRHRAARAACSSASHADAQLTLEVRRSNDGAISLYERFGFRSAGRATALLPGQWRGRDRHVADPGDVARHARRRPRHVILALETSCDDTCAAVVTRGGRDPLQRRLLAGRPRPLRRRRAGMGVAPPPRARQPRSSTTRSREPRVTLDDVELVAVTQGPGLVGALLVGVATAKGLAAARAAAARAGRPPAGPRGRELPRPRSVRAALRVPAGVRRPHAAGARHRLRRLRDRSARRSTTPPARRSTRARGCSASATRAARRSRSSRPSGDRAAFKFPTGARVAGLDFSFAGLKTALLYKVRDLGPEQTARARRRPRRLLRARDRRRAADPRSSARWRRPSRGWRSAAAWPPTGCCASAPPRSACRSTSRPASSAPTTRR